VVVFFVVFMIMMVVVDMMMIMIMIVRTRRKRWRKRSGGELFLRNLMKLYLNIEHIAEFCNLAAFQFCVQPPP
jgi:hypothetical protein